MSNNKLHWFLVKLTLSGLNESEALKGLADLQEELEARTYLRNAQIRWIPEKQVIYAEIEANGANAASVSAAVYDDFFESAVATIQFSSDEGLGIKVIDTSLLP